MSPPQAQCPSLFAFSSSSFPPPAGPPCAFHVLGCTDRPRPPLSANRGFPFCRAKGAKGKDEELKKENIVSVSERTRPKKKQPKNEKERQISLWLLARSLGNSNLLNQSVSRRALFSRLSRSQETILFPAAKNTSRSRQPRRDNGDACPCSPPRRTNCTRGDGND